MTYLTYDNVFTWDTFVNIGFLWIAVWTTIIFFLLSSRKNKERVDYEVIMFFASSSFIAWAISVRDVIHFSNTIIGLAILTKVYTSCATAIRIWITIQNEKKNSETNIQGVERRHKEMVTAVENRHAD